MLCLSAFMMFCMASVMYDRIIDTMHGGIGSAFLAAWDGFVLILWLDSFDLFYHHLKELKNNESD